MELTCAIQGRQHPAAGDERRAGRAGRQQRADLDDRSCVVEDQQNAPPRHQRPEARCGLLDVDRDIAAVHAEPTQQPGHQLTGAQWPQPGSGTLQVHVELPIGKPEGEPMGRVHRER